MGKLRPEAWKTAALVGAAGAVLLVGYDAARRTAVNQLRAAYGEGAEASVLSAMPLGVLAVIALAGMLLTRQGPRKTFRTTALACAGALALCQVGVISGFQPATLGFAFMREIYVVLMIEQLWSLLNSALTEREARALNGPVTGIGSLGAIAGALAVGPIAGLIGADAMPALSVGTVLLAAVLVDRAYAVAGEPQPPVDPPEASDTLGLGPLLRSRTLLLLLGVVLVTRVLSATVSLGFEGAVAAASADPAAAAATEDGVYAALNGLIAVMQFVAAPLLLTYLPTGLVWVGLPLVQLGASLALLLWPGVGTAAAALIVFRSFEYSLFRDTKELFYQSRGFAVRYRSKLLIDVLGHRGGKAMLALLLGAPTLANTRLVSLSPGLSVAAALVWVGLAAAMVRGGAMNDQI